jgi:hypothetical protein
MGPCPTGERRLVGALGEDHLALGALASHRQLRHVAHRMLMTAKACATLPSPRQRAAVAWPAQLLEGWPS